MRFFKQIVAAWRRLTRTYRGKNKLRWITVHETANTNRGADAQAHANLQSKGNVRNASWHESIDDREAIQSYPDTDRCWHAGDGKGDGNLNSYAIEICVNRDGDYRKAIANAAARVRAKMDEHNIPLSRVVPHRHWSGKTCPRNLLSGAKGITWDQFLAMVDASGTSTAPTPKPKPTPVATLPTQIEEDGYAGQESIGAWQIDFGTPHDRTVSSQSEYWRDRNPGLTSGWEWVAPSKAVGSQLIGAMQDWNGTPRQLRDLLAGKDFWKRTQRKLKKMGYYSGKIDGRIDAPSITIKALQRAHNDGKLRQK